MHNTVPTVNQEVLDLFNDPDFEPLLKTLATEFGDGATLASINKAYQDNRPVPEKLVNGTRYLAGYKGRLMLPEGTVKAKLIDIKQAGSSIKLMFSPIDSHTFVYHNFPRESVRVEQIVKLANSLNTEFKVHIVHETIPATGDKHAVVDVVQGLSDIIS